MAGWVGGAFTNLEVLVHWFLRFPCAKIVEQRCVSCAFEGLWFHDGLRCWVDAGHRSVLFMLSSF